jgi:hypothetical protein
MMHLIKDGQPMADCPFCDKPLHHGNGGVTNGLHAECDNQFNEELELHEASTVETRRETWRERKLRQAEAMFGKVGSSRMSRAMEKRVAEREG